MRFISLVLLSLALISSNLGCATYDLNTKSGVENAQSTVRGVSDLSFSLFLHSKDQKSGIKLAKQIETAADQFLKIDPFEKDVLKKLSIVVMDINNNYPEELKNISSEITSVIKNQLGLKPIEKHFYLVHAAASGAKTAVESYLLKTNGK